MLKLNDYYDLACHDWFERCICILFEQYICILEKNMTLANEEICENFKTSKMNLSYNNVVWLYSGKDELLCEYASKIRVIKIDMLTNSKKIKHELSVIKKGEILNKKLCWDVVENIIVYLI